MRLSRLPWLLGQCFFAVGVPLSLYLSIMAVRSSDATSLLSLYTYALNVYIAVEVWRARAGFWPGRAYLRLGHAGVAELHFPGVFQEPLRLHVTAAVRPNQGRLRRTHVLPGIPPRLAIQVAPYPQQQTVALILRDEEPVVARRRVRAGSFWLRRPDYQLVSETPTQVSAVWIRPCKRDTPRLLGQFSDQA